MYRVLVADPAWLFNDALPGETRGAEKQYDCQTIEEIMEMSLPVMEKDCYLFLWRVAADDFPEDAYRVVRAWGFKPKTEIVWDKLTRNGLPWFGLGHHTRASHETCIIAVRGKPKPLVKNIRSRFEAKVPDKPRALGEKLEYWHSAKPDEFYDLVRKLALGPYAEMYARKYRQGWHSMTKEGLLIHPWPNIVEPSLEQIHHVQAHRNRGNRRCRQEDAGGSASAEAA